MLIRMVQSPLPPRRASVNTTLVRDMSPSTNGTTNLPAVESFGRRGVEGSNFIDQLVASVVGGEGWRIDDDQEGGGEGTPTPNHLGYYTGRHSFEERVALQTPA